VERQSRYPRSPNATVHWRRSDDCSATKNCLTTWSCPVAWPSFRPQRCSRRSISASSVAVRPQSSSTARYDKGLARPAGILGGGSRASRRSNALLQDL